jgi:hypothetical protein
MVPTMLNNILCVTIYQWFLDLQLHEGYWKIDYITMHTFSGWGSEKLLAPVKPVKKDVRSAKPAKNKNKKDSEYMHLPQKHLPTQPLSIQKTKMFKVPIIPRARLETISSSGKQSDISALTLSKFSNR